MTTEQFTVVFNEATDNFTNGVIDKKEFHSKMFETMYTIVKDHLEKEPDDYKDPVIDIIKNLFKPSDKDNGTFYTVYDIIQFIMVKTGLEITHIRSLKKDLEKLNFEETTYRKPYSRTAQRGYWLIVKE